MRTVVFAAGCVTAFTAAGLYSGFAIHGSTVAAFIPALAGAAGGLGVGSLAADAVRARQGVPARRPSRSQSQPV